jgi:hypothetical protein
MGIAANKPVFVLIVIAMIAALPGAVGARDRGVNQPGAVGNVAPDPGLNQPGAAGNRRGFRRY